MRGLNVEETEERTPVERVEEAGREEATGARTAFDAYAYACEDLNGTVFAYTSYAYLYVREVSGYLDWLSFNSRNFIRAVTRHVMNLCLSWHREFKTQNLALHHAGSASNGCFSLLTVIHEN
jgi:hypothetical protein